MILFGKFIMFRISYINLENILDIGSKKLNHRHSLCLWDFYCNYKNDVMADCNDKTDSVMTASINTISPLLYLEVILK